MAYQQSDLDAIDAAIASGELSVSANGRSTTYRDMNDLLKARAHIVRELAAQQRRPSAHAIGGLGVSLARFD